MWVVDLHGNVCVDFRKVDFFKCISLPNLQCDAVVLVSRGTECGKPIDLSVSHGHLQ